MIIYNYYFFRERCAKELFKSTLIHKVVDIFAVLDCVLDEHFKSLKVCIPCSADALKPFSFLIAIITRQCPMLEELQVDFHFKLETFKKPELYTIPAPGSLLPGLRSLTLNFHHGDPLTFYIYDTRTSRLSSGHCWEALPGPYH